MTASLSTRAQLILLAWAAVFAVGYVLTLVFLLDMVPPPRATLPVQQVADWYAQRHTQIRVGALISSVTSGFLLPLSIVIAVQLARIEGGQRVWAIAAGAGGVMSSIAMMLPPMFWGVAAYTPTRDPEAIAALHDFGVLAMVGVLPFFLFQFVAVIVICFRTTTIAASPFPRWLGYFTGWCALMFEGGPIAYLTKTGPFAWDGVLAFWSPFILVVAWMSVMIALLANALRHQYAAPIPL